MYLVSLVLNLVKSKLIIKVYFISISFSSKYLKIAAGKGLFGDGVKPTQWVDRQAAAPKIFGYSDIAYQDINPPIDEPAIAVFSLSVLTE